MLSDKVLIHYVDIILLNVNNTDCQQKFRELLYSIIVNNTIIYNK